MGFGDGFRVLRGGGGGLGGGLLGGFRGSGEHLHYLFEGGGISLDEGSGIGIYGLGSSDGFWRVQVQLRRRRRWGRWRHELDSIAGAATAATGVGDAATGRRKKRRRAGA